MAFKDSVITFLLNVLLPWVIDLMIAAVNKYLRPFATQEAFDALGGLFQKFYDEAVAKGNENVQFFIAGVMAPIFGITIVTPAPVEPVALKAKAMSLLKDVAQELDASEPLFKDWDESENPWNNTVEDDDGGGGG